MAPVNWMLEKIFAGERHALVDLLRGHRDRPLAYGVSLVALLQRIEGDAAIHMRPADVAADPYDPIRGEWV
jgi:hypothetical protein